MSGFWSSGKLDSRGRGFELDGGLSTSILKLGMIGCRVELAAELTDVELYFRSPGDRDLTKTAKIQQQNRLYFQFSILTQLGS
jgi:hypothetical protein